MTTAGGSEKAQCRDQAASSVSAKRSRAAWTVWGPCLCLCLCQQVRAADRQRQEPTAGQQLLLDERPIS